MCIFFNCSLLQLQLFVDSHSHYVWLPVWGDRGRAIWHKEESTNSEACILICKLHKKYLVRFLTEIHFFPLLFDVPYLETCWVLCSFTWTNSESNIKMLFLFVKTLPKELFHIVAFFPGRVEEYIQHQFHLWPINLDSMFALYLFLWFWQLGSLPASMGFLHSETRT